MRLRLLVAPFLVVAFAPPAFANDPPYPVCAPPAAFTWHVGTVAYATSAYTVQLHADATEAWARVGAAGPWIRTKVRRDAGGAYTTIRPQLGRGALAVGFRSSNAGGTCLALEQRTVTVRRRVPVAGLHAVIRRRALQASGFPKDHGCHSLGGGSFTWRLDTIHGKKARYIRLGTGCGPVGGAGVPTRGARVRSTFYTVLVGTAAKAGAPAAFLVVRAAHPRRSGTVRFNLTGISADLPDCRGCDVMHEQSAVIGVTVKVAYRRGLHPSWKTSVRFGRWFHSSHAGTSGGTSSGGGGGVILGGGDGNGAGDGSCSGSCFRSRA